MAKRHASRSTPRSPDDDVITVPRLEWCLDRLSLIMHRAGKYAEVYLPIFERLESEIEILEERSHAGTCTRSSRALHARALD